MDDNERRTRGDGVTEDADRRPSGRAMGGGYGVQGTLGTVAGRCFDACVCACCSVGCTMSDGRCIVRDWNEREDRSRPEERMCGVTLWASDRWHG